MAKSILIVDDSSSLRQIVNMALTREGYSVLEATDGRQALDMLATTRVNLIVSDVNMPRMDGITFVTELKRDPRLKFTPVIMLTTENQQSKMEQGRAAGAKAWLTKPFSPSVLLDAVEQLISR